MLEEIIAYSDVKQHNSEHDAHSGRITSRLVQFFVFLFTLRTLNPKFDTHRLMKAVIHQVNHERYCWIGAASY